MPERIVKVRIESLCYALMDGSIRKLMNQCNTFLRKFQKTGGQEDKKRYMHVFEE